MENKLEESLKTLESVLEGTDVKIYIPSHQSKNLDIAIKSLHATIMILMSGDTAKEVYADNFVLQFEAYRTLLELFVHEKEKPDEPIRTPEMDYGKTLQDKIKYFQEWRKVLAYNK